MAPQTHSSVSNNGEQDQTDPFLGQARVGLDQTVNGADQL